MVRHFTNHSRRQVDSLSRSAATQLIRGWMKTRIPWLLVSGAILAILFRTTEGFLAAAAAGSLAGFVATYLLVFKLNEIRLSWVLGDGLVLGYALGAFNTAGRLYIQGLSVSQYFARPQDDLSSALAASLSLNHPFNS
jgi:hypothetical protein